MPNGSTLSLAQGASRHEAVAHLSHLTHPPTRHVLLAVNEQWTAVLNNNRTGSDFADYQGWFGRLCDARTVRVVDSEDATRRIGDYVWGPTAGRGVVRLRRSA
jgi:hypothetical protein